MARHASAFLPLAFVFSAALLVPAPAAAQRIRVKICNTGSTLLYVAKTWAARNKWYSRGWYHVKPRGCETFIDDRFQSLTPELALDANGRTSHRRTHDGPWHFAFAIVDDRGVFGTLDMRAEYYGGRLEQSRLVVCGHRDGWQGESRSGVSALARCKKEPGWMPVRHQQVVYGHHLGFDERIDIPAHANQMITSLWVQGDGPKTAARSNTGGESGIGVGAVIALGFGAWLLHELGKGNAPAPAAKAAPVPPAVAEAWKAFNRDDAATARRLAEAPAIAGNADARALYGMLLFYGMGGPQDRDAGFDYIKKASSQRQPAAMYYMARLQEAKYFGPALTARNHAIAYSEAAQAGSWQAQYRLGDLFAEGKGVDKDLRAALKWYLKAAEAGYARAQAKAGEILLYGDAGATDYARALEWLRRAADQRDAWAQFFLGEAYENGWGVARDPEEAARWYRLAAAQGDEGARTALERIKR